MNTSAAVPPQIQIITITGPRQAALMAKPFDQSPLRPNEVAGRTLGTLVSPGTELNYHFDQPAQTPLYPGYAAIFQVDAVGAEVHQIVPGQRVFCMGPHGSYQRAASTDVLPVPENLATEQALFARLMGVSWSTLTTAVARPPERVVVMGLGIVGNLAAQIFHAAGYPVTAVDPVESRRVLAQRCGLLDVRASLSQADDLNQQVALAVDCSGHEQAVLDACRIVRKRGEVVLVGVPWKRRTDLTAFDLLHSVFHRYVVLRSGWEWELPMHPRDFTTGSIYGNWAGAMHWLTQQRIHLDGLYRVALPSHCQQVYEELLHQRGAHLTVLFDWQRVV